MRRVPPVLGILLTLTVVAVNACERDGEGTGIQREALGGPNGAACGQSADCASGNCVDGVCCDLPCGGSAADDCQACAVSAGAARDGECALVAAGVTCRAANGGCDVAETCTGTFEFCPSDAFAAPSTVCAPPSCDSAAATETLAALCTGNSPLCPPGFQIPCTPSYCYGNACALGCVTDAICPLDAYCDGAELCFLKKVSGAPCRRSAEC